MDRLQAMKVFLRVVETNSFVRAAETLSLPASSVTGMVKALEKHLQVRLLNRTTRSLSLTPEGEQYALRCQEVLELIERTESSLRGSHQQPKGRLRVDMPSGIAHSVLLPQLHAFHQQFPDIYLSIGANDRQVDLIYEGVDCVIRTGDLVDSALVAQRIGALKWVTCASVEYLNQSGTPLTPEDMSGHRSIHYFSHTSRHSRDFRFLNDGELITVPMEGSLAVNETELYMKLCKAGHGLIQVAEIIVADAIRSGELKEVLADFRPAPVTVSLVYPHQKFISPPMRAFSEWIKQVFTDALNAPGSAVRS